MTGREILGEAHYCVLVPRSGKDSCSKGFRRKRGGYRKNRSNPAAGLPARRKISEAHASSARATLSRPGGDLTSTIRWPRHRPRICNDCMKGCIYQKQEPVNIPQIETGILTDVWVCPIGFEIWSLLTRLEPAESRRPYPRFRSTGRNVLVVGSGRPDTPWPSTSSTRIRRRRHRRPGRSSRCPPIGPAPTGSRRARYATSGDHGCFGRARAVRLRRCLGIWHHGPMGQEFLTMIHSPWRAARRPACRRRAFRRTITVEQAWEMGFDHVAIAAAPAGDDHRHEEQPDPRIRKPPTS